MPRKRKTTDTRAIAAAASILGVPDDYVSSIDGDLVHLDYEPAGRMHGRRVRVRMTKQLVPPVSWRWPDGGPVRSVIDIDTGETVVAAGTGVPIGETDRTPAPAPAPAPAPEPEPAPEPAHAAPVDPEEGDQ